MATYNGDRFIAEQLESIDKQTYTDWKLIVSDDGSSDRTLEVLKDYAVRWEEGRLVTRSGPGQGFCSNFMSLACAPDLSSDFYAFADQDDIWEYDKIERATKWLNNLSPCKPAVYCSRTRNITENGEFLSLSPRHSTPPSFSNALVQSIGGGNTMVFNEAALQLLVLAGPDVSVPSHDWWLYIQVSGCGGQVFYDSEPSVNYRQHNSNLIGANTGFRATLGRILKIFNGRLSSWNDQHLLALARIRPQLTPENIVILDGFSELRNQTAFARLVGFWKMKVHRQTWLEQFGLWLAVFFKRI